MKSLEQNLITDSTPTVYCNGFEIYNPKGDLTNIDNVNGVDDTPVKSSTKKLVTLLGTLGSLGLVCTLGELPYPYDIVGTVSAPVLALVGLVSWMSYSQIEHPSKYSSFGEMLANFKNDVEPKNRAYQYLKRKFSSSAKTPHLVPTQGEFDNQFK